MYFLLEREMNVQYIGASERRNGKCRAQAHSLSRFHAPRSRFSWIYPGNTQLLIAGWFAPKSFSWRLPVWKTSRSLNALTCRGESSPNDFPDLESLEAATLQFQTRYNQIAEPFKWKYTKDDLKKTLSKIPAHTDPIDQMRLAA